MNEYQFFNNQGSKLPYTKNMWGTCDTLEKYNSNKHIHEIWNKIPISYEYNNYGFRCDDFYENTSDTTQIVFAGCSYTEGEALPLDKCWANLVYNKIKSEYNLSFPYWNIGSGGTGLDHMIRYCWHFMPILKPTHIVSLVPNIHRREPYLDYRWLPALVDKDFDKIYVDEKVGLYEYERNLSILSTMAELWNFDVIMFYHRWEIQKNNIDIPILPRLHNYIIDVTYIDYGRDNQHFGIKTAQTVANYIFNFTKNHIKNV